MKAFILLVWRAYRPLPKPQEREIGLWITTKGLDALFEEGQKALACLEQWRLRSVLKSRLRTLCQKFTFWHKRALS